MLLAQAAGDEVHVRWTVRADVTLHELGDGLVRAAVIENDDLREVENGDARRVQLPDLTLDAEAQRPSGRAGHEV